MLRRSRRLASAFHDAQTALRMPRPIVPGRPKSTLLGGYFHDAAIAGMTDPFALETLLAPDLLDVERPFVIAHEWGHLAGYADESEANFIAWLACLRGTPRAQYSAWLTLFGHVYAAAGNKREVIGALRVGPRIDLAIDLRSLRADATLRAVCRARDLRSISAGEQGRAWGGELRRSRSAHPGNDLRSGRQSAVALSLRRAACTMVGRGRALHQSGRSIGFRRCISRRFQAGSSSSTSVGRERH